MEVLPPAGDAAVRHPGAAAAGRQAVGLICDRDVTGGGIEVEFSAEGPHDGGPAALAVQTGAALMPVILWFEGDHWGVHIHEEIPVPAGGDREQKAAAMMQEVARLSRQVSGLIRRTGTCCRTSSSPTSTPPWLAAAKAAAGARREGGS